MVRKNFMGNLIMLVPFDLTEKEARSWAGVSENTPLTNEIWDKACENFLKHLVEIHCWNEVNDIIWEEEVI